MQDGRRAWSGGCWQPVRGAFESAARRASAARASNTHTHAGTRQPTLAGVRARHPAACCVRSGVALARDVDAPAARPATLTRSGALCPPGPHRPPNTTTHPHPEPTRSPPHTAGSPRHPTPAPHRPDMPLPHRVPEAPRASPPQHLPCLQSPVRGVAGPAGASLGGRQPPMSPAPSQTRAPGARLALFPAPSAQPREVRAWKGRGGPSAPRQLHAPRAAGEAGGASSGGAGGAASGSTPPACPRRGQGGRARAGAAMA